MSTENEKLAELFKDPEHVAAYLERPKQFVPGLDALHNIMVQLIKESLPNDGQILALGAGGGLELRSLFAAFPEARCVGVDPSRPMIDLALQVNAAHRGQLTFVEGLIDDAPEGPFDAATCLLTLHFVPDDGSKLATLQAVRSRLKPGAPFFVAHMAVDKGAADASLWFDRYLQYAVDRGMDIADAHEARTRVAHSLNCVAPDRDKALLTEAGFKSVALVFVGLTWHGWIAYA